MQSLNALFPIRTIPSGITISSRLSRPLKAFCGSSAIPWGISTSFNPLPQKGLSYGYPLTSVQFAGIFTFFRFVQPSNTFWPISATLSGSWSSVSPRQSANALSPITSTPRGRRISVSPAFRNAPEWIVLVLPGT